MLPGRLRDFTQARANTRFSTPGELAATSTKAGFAAAVLWPLACNTALQPYAANSKNSLSF
jgi:hypothetical protein